MDYGSLLEPPDKPQRTSGMFREIQDLVQAFENALDPGKDVGFMFSSYGSGVMIVTDISYRDPELFIFRGFIDGKESVLIQSKAQLNFLLTSENRPDTAPSRAPIGFSLGP